MEPLTVEEIVKIRESLTEIGMTDDNPILRLCGTDALHKTLSEAEAEAKFWKERFFADEPESVGYWRKRAENVKRLSDAARQASEAMVLLAGLAGSKLNQDISWTKIDEEVRAAIAELERNNGQA